ncbi:S41 family peptidase [Candidatus Fokinia crypta]|uniref:S41 family protease n=1 Tax=Candidatus Fokinia crypta TaxID=1920990 RepID=A0ABZ0UP93_9RICK|nr:S41 family peptidase [Candidatus Fokinia cryptica]WPX97944.1 Putative S41 family protease [Candidatus Fokinia cryptica]
MSSILLSKTAFSAEVGESGLIGVIRTIESNYITTLPREKIIEAAVNGIFKSLDCDSKFISNSELKIFRDKLSSSVIGLGIVYSFDKEDLGRVKYVMHNSPAYRAGIQRNDIILQIDNHKLETLSIPMIREKMSSERKVVLRILRGSNTRELALQSAEIKREQFYIRKIANRSQILYIKIYTFAHSLSTQLKSEIEKALRDNTIKGIILDLRYNNGGLLNEGINTVNLFLNKNLPIIKISEGDGMINTIYSSNFDDIIGGRPMIVLMNRLSASSSEVVIAGLKHNKRAILIGSRTFGKGSIQELFPIQDFGITLTISTFLSPSGTSINGVGIAPDIEIPFEIDTSDVLYNKIKNDKMNQSTSFNNTSFLLSLDNSKVDDAGEQDSSIELDCALDAMLSGANTDPTIVKSISIMQEMIDKITH